MARLNVLLIEEDPKQVELLSELIREIADCKVDVISRIESSVDWVSRSNYHLVVICGPTGEIDELSVLEQIKRHSPGTSVILISDKATVENAVSAIRMGAEDYLKKPFSLEAFQLAVKRCFDRRAVFGANQGASHFLSLLNACQMISASLERRKIFEVIQSYLSRELKSNHCAIYALEEGNPVRVSDASDPGQTGDHAMEEILDISLHASNPLPGLSESGEFAKFIDRGQLTPGLFIFRFKCVGNSDFFCVCISPAKPGSMTDFESRLRMLRAQIELTGKSIEQYLGVERLAFVDDATGLYNTRYLSSILDREIAQSMSSGKPFAVLFVDADKFKSINDGHGHLVGTKLLNELGDQLRKLVRDTDTCFRYGGDEFVAVLSGCDLPTAQVVAERIRASVESKAFLADEGLNLHFTVSIGVALFPDHAGSKRDIIEAADHAMYGAKKKSRNCVTIAEVVKPAPSTESRS